MRAALPLHRSRKYGWPLPSGGPASEPQLELYYVNDMPLDFQQ